MRNTPPQNPKFGGSIHRPGSTPSAKFRVLTTSAGEMIVPQSEVHEVHEVREVQSEVQIFFLKTTLINYNQYFHMRT